MKIFLLIVLLGGAGFWGCVASFGLRAAENRLVIYLAGSLSVPFEKMVRAFEAANPHVDIVRKSGGSTRMANLIAVNHEPADIMVSADYAVIEKILIPKYAEWNICFATNQLVLCYTDNSRYAREINQNNWYRVLARNDVSWGHSDPDLDPCGYRSLMVLQLAEKYYDKNGLYESLIANRPEKNIRPKAAELVDLLKTGTLDYVWEYLSVAVQQGVKYIRLPDEINLGSSAHDPIYSRVTVTVAGNDSGARVVKKGRSCTYGVTLIKKSKNQALARAFLSYLLDPNGGLKLLAEMGQPPIVPCRLSSKKMRAVLPESLKGRVAT